MNPRLKSRSQSPVDGFRFTQKETGWKSWIADPITLWDFNALVSALLQHRLANPKFKLPTDPVSIANEVDETNAIRMTTIKGAESYIAQGGGQAYEIKKAIPERLRDVAAKVRLVNAGAGLIEEWKMKGYGVVPREEANRRAEICTRCPKNGDGGLERFFTVPASNLIKKQIEELRSHKLTTDYDDRINVCEACLCPLKVKVHCEMALILKHQLPEAKAALWENCWIGK